MHTERIGIFKKENPGKDFPKFVEVSAEECKRISAMLSQKFLKDTYSGLDLLSQLIKKSKRQSNVDATLESFSLLSVLKENGISVSEDGYVDYYRLDRMLRMRMQDIDSYFPYLFYPSADDIQIFDTTLSWMIFIAHDGEVFIL